MAMRWKKWARETGLRAVGAGPYRSIDYHDGGEVFATVYPLGGNWKGPLRGWYFTGRVGDQTVNTSSQPLDTEQEAKAAAAKWVKFAIKAGCRT